MMRGVVIAGVSGSGKTTVGRRVAEELKVAFLDADDFHPPQNVEKMRAGHALTDEDRAGWLDVLGGELAKRNGVVMACSALKRSYRDRLRELAGELEFYVLEVPVDELRSRMEGREHFMPPGLLDSQLATLELDDDVTRIPNSDAVEDAVAAVVEGPRGS